jgi:hypothetical protein
LGGITSHSRAQSLLEIAAGIKFCKTLTDDSQRLKCFDSLFTKKEEPPAEKPQTAMSWSIEESKSPVDDSPQVTAMLHADGSTDSPSLTRPATGRAFLRQPPFNSFAHCLTTASFSSAQLGLMVRMWMAHSLSARFRKSEIK